MVDTLGQLTTSSEGLPDTQKKLQELASSITQRISTEKDTYEKADSDLKELSQHLEKKEYVKAIATLLKLLFNSFSLKSSNGFAHLDKYLKQLHLDGKTQTEILTLIQKFSEDLEKSNFSISDITDTTFLLSACKDRRFQMECQTKQQQSPTPYDSLLYHLHHNLSNTGSSPKDPTGTILLFNR
ncbi:MAG: hypothetical protein LBU27_06335 [Candidatus Peribacteria bacterium]|jgi:hypothetical protein|nr:hypothetical protein [Candidatus Peribacteria bacterium]